MQTLSRFDLSAFDWLNEHLPCPPFQSNLKLGKWTEDAVCWFLPQAKEPISRMWDLVAVLKEHDVPVKVLHSQKPGLIVYRDEYQIVAETWEYSHLLTGVGPPPDLSDI